MTKTSSITIDELKTAEKVLRCLTHNLAIHHLINSNEWDTERRDRSFSEREAVIDARSLLMDQRIKEQG